MSPRLTRPALLLVLTACGDSSGTGTTGPATTGPADTGTTTGSMPMTGDPDPTPTTSGDGAGTTAVEATTTAPTDTTGPVDPGDGSSGEPALTTGEPMSTTGADTSSDTTDASTGEPAPVCGNGVVEAGEACDLGPENSESGACSPQCQLPVCGDGELQGGETCDDGSGVACDSTHDGGDGTCVPAGTCVTGFILVMGDCVAELVTDHVHIEVDNFCKMKVTPAEFTVLPGQKLRLSYHNHSADYPVDVWMHYNGGFTDLPPGQTWNEKYEHCFGPNPSEGWAEISTACSQYELPIHCK